MKIITKRSEFIDSHSGPFDFKTNTKPVDPCSICRHWRNGGDGCDTEESEYFMDYEGKPEFKICSEFDTWYLFPDEEV